MTYEEKLRKAWSKASIVLRNLIKKELKELKNKKSNLWNNLKTK